MLLKPYPYPDPDRILVVGEQKPRPTTRPACRYLDMRDWKEANSVFTTIAAVSGRSLTISDGSRAGALPRRRRLVGSVSDARHASDSWPRTSPPRTIAKARADVVLLGYDVWMHRYRGKSRHHRPIDPDQQQAARRRRRDAAGIRVSKQPEDSGFRSFRSSPRIRATFRGLFAFGRLKPGVTDGRRRGRSWMRLRHGLATQYPDTNEGWVSQPAHAARGVSSSRRCRSCSN